MVVMKRGSFSSCEVQEATGHFSRAGLLLSCGMRLPLWLWQRALLQLGLGRLLLGILYSCISFLALMSSWDSEHGVPHKSLQGNQDSSHVERGISWFFLSWGGKLRVPLQLRLVPQDTSCVASGESGLLSSCQGELGIALESLQGNRASSLVEVGNSGFI